MKIHPVPTLVVCVVRLSCALLAQDAGTAANRLPNPSFEEATRGEVGGWITRAWQGESNQCWSVEAPGRTGGRCVSIHSTKGTDAAWTARATVQPASLYRLSGWIKTRNVQGAVGALLNLQNLQRVRTGRVTGTADWTYVSTVFHTGEATEVEVNCLFGGWGQATGQAWYDDVALEPLPDPDTGDPWAVLTIRPDAPARPYSRMIFGGFIEHFDSQIHGGLFEPGSPLADEQGFRKDVIAAMKELKLCTNAGNGTPEEMQAWVEYCNGVEGDYAGWRRAQQHPEPHRVRFWSIGNENWGGHEIGARTPREWGPLVRRSAELMRAADPDLTLLAAATPDRGWTLPLLETAGPLLDYVAIHEYWLPCWGENLTPDYLTCIMHSEGPERTITRVVELLAEAHCRGRIKIAFDEWNLRGWHHPGFPRKAVSDPDDPAVRELIRAREKNAIASQYTMADALFSASFLNACLRHAEDVGMANIAPIVNTRGPLFVHPGGVVKRTTFHTLALYASQLEARVARLEVEASHLSHNHEVIAVADAIATVDEDGQAYALALVNRHPTQALTCTLKLGEALLEGTYAATVLAGDSAEAYNDIEHPHRVVPVPTQLTLRQGVVRLPPHSLTILKVAEPGEDRRATSHRTGE